MKTKLSRREVISYLRNIIGTAGVYPLLPVSLQASNASGDDEHYFIFVELKGGLHYGIATDCPDPNSLPDDKNIVMPLTLNEDGTLKQDYTLTPEQLAYLNYTGKIDTLMSEQDVPIPLGYLTDAYFAALPPCVAHGNTGAGYRYSLGWSASPLKDYVNKLSVLRGVYMQGTFHGPANEEIYSGAKDGSKPHVAGVLAKLLTEKYKVSKPLDNLVLDGAAYVVGDGAMPAIKLPSSAISKVVEKIGGEGFALQQPRKVLEALQDTYGFAGMEDIVSAYLASFAKAEQIKQKLKTTGIKGGDISLNVKQQLDACAALFHNDLARVITICTGRDGGFGAFDAHGGLYAKDEEETGTPHSKFLQDTMQGIADFIKSIEDPKHENHALKGKVTMIISSEYGRNNNFAGSLTAYNEDYNPAAEIKEGKEGEEGEEQEEEGENLSLTNNLGMLGNGHFFPNNNYIFYGKGIQAGVWLGESDPVSRFPYCAKFKNPATANAENITLAAANAENITEAFVDPFTTRPVMAGGKLTAKEGFVNVGINFDPNALDASKGMPHMRGHAKTIRALMARDVVRTIMHCAGLGDEYEKYYGNDDSEELPAYAITQLLED